MRHLQLLSRRTVGAPAIVFQDLMTIILGILGALMPFIASKERSR